jgi:hypothetical protein
MRFSTVAKTLLILGALVGAAAGLALALGLRLDQLPPWMITVGMYKLAFMAAGGLLVAGAILGRATQRSSARPEADQADVAQSVLGPGPFEASDRAAREPDRLDRDGRHN